MGMSACLSSVGKVFTSGVSGVISHCSAQSPANELDLFHLKVIWYDSLSSLEQLNKKCLVQLCNTQMSFKALNVSRSPGLITEGFCNDALWLQTPTRLSFSLWYKSSRPVQKWWELSWIRLVWFNHIGILGPKQVSHLLASSFRMSEGFRRACCGQGSELLGFRTESGQFNQTWRQLDQGGSWQQQ